MAKAYDRDWSFLLLVLERFRLSNLWIEVDSSLVYCIICSGGPQSIQATLKHISHLLSLDSYTISHIYRERNQVANSLQKVRTNGCTHVQINRYGLFTFSSLQTIVSFFIFVQEVNTTSFTAFVFHALDWRSGLCPHPLYYLGSIYIMVRKSYSHPSCLVEPKKHIGDVMVIQ